MSWLLSENKNSFISKISKLMLENTKLNIVNDQKGSPVSSDFVAKVCNKLILKRET